MDPRVMLPERKPVMSGVVGLLFAVGLAAPGCAKSVNGDGNSGKDLKYKGAKRINIEDNEGRSHLDIVTYPGGDRVDWKVFDLGPPKDEDEDKRKRDKDAPPEPPPTTGTLKVAVRWKTPRAGLDLAFDVYDQYFHRIARAKPAPDSGKRSKKVTIKDATAGKYYVQVYAPARGDAAQYRVTIKFQAQSEIAAAAATVSDVPDPPTLPALPEASVADGAGGTGVDGTGPGGTGPGGTGPGGTGPVTPPPPTVDPVKARVVKYTLSGGGVTITVDRGRNAGVEPGWKGQVIGASGKPVQGGDFVVSKVTGAEAIGKVSLSVDQITAAKRVVLTPAP
jgi:hypothetical protein